jgi:hypothetical protein
MVRGLQGPTAHIGFLQGPWQSQRDAERVQGPHARKEACVQGARSKEPSEGAGTFGDGTTIECRDDSPTPINRKSKETT